MLAGYTQKTPYKPFQFLGGSRPKKKLEGFLWRFLSINWATISETICPEMLVFGK